MIEINNLSFGYDKKMVLDNINLTLEKGFTSIIGPNGSGKSTLMKIVSGLIEPDVGTIKIDGKDLNQISLKDRAKCYAIINQKQAFSFPFTCMELVALGRYPYNKNMNALAESDYEIIIECMEAMQVLPFKDKMITDISGGEQQRVVIACALAQQTKLLFLDEAFSALDISHKAKTIKLLKQRVEKHNLTVVSIMHDLNMAYRYSDNVCIIKNGHIAGYNTPEKVMNKERLSEVFDVDIEIVEGKGIFII